MENKDLTVSKYLENLISKIIKVIYIETKAGNIKHELEEILQLELEDFAYTAEGVNNTKSFIKYTDRKIWFRATLYLEHIIADLPEFTLAESYIKENYSIENVPTALRGFAKAIFRECFECPTKPDKRKVGNIKKIFINDLNAQPIKAKATVELYGIILESYFIKIDNYATIRQTQKSDLEIINAIDPYRPGMKPMFHAVLEIKFNLERLDGSGFNEIVGKYISLLRLFGVGSIKYNSFKMSSDTLTASHFNATFGSIYALSPSWKNYFLKKSGENALKRFIKKLKVPHDFYAVIKNVDYLTTAFDRYSECLLENAAIEKKIATAIMGLEALLSSDFQELSFKLQIRTAKLMACFGLRPIEVRKRLNQAYAIRSNFAHGGYLKDKDRNKLESHFGGPTHFALAIIDYLRITLVTLIASGIDKTELINMIDDAFIDSDKYVKLKTRLGGCKNLINLSNT